MIKLVYEMLIFDEYFRPNIEKIAKSYKDFLIIKEFKWLDELYFIYRI